MLVDNVAPQAPLVVGELDEAITLVIAEDKTVLELSAVED
jgi:F420-0:gamma-glutamyl ligase